MCSLKDSSKEMCKGSLTNVQGIGGPEKVHKSVRRGGVGSLAFGSTDSASEHMHRSLVQNQSRTPKSTLRPAKWSPNYECVSQMGAALCHLEGKNSMDF